MFTSKCSGNLISNRQFFVITLYSQRYLVCLVKSLQRPISKLKKRSRPDHVRSGTCSRKRTKISSSNLWKVFYIFIDKTASGLEDIFSVLYSIDNSFQHSSYHLCNDDTGLEPVFVIPNSKRYDRHSLTHLKSSRFTSFN